MIYQLDLKKMIEKEMENLSTIAELTGHRQTVVLLAIAERLEQLNKNLVTLTNHFLGAL